MDFCRRTFAYTAVIEGGRDMKTAKLDSRAKGLRRSTSQITVLHIPHSSQRVPAEERQTILLDDAALNNELLRMTDAFTDELFPLTPVEVGRVIFPLSRLVHSSLWYSRYRPPQVSSFRL
jgi:hypothetical protein